MVAAVTWSRWSLSLMFLSEVRSMTRDVCSCAASLQTEKRAGPVSSLTGGIRAFVKPAPQTLGIVVLPPGESIWRGSWTVSAVEAAGCAIGSARRQARERSLRGAWRGRRRL